MLILLTNELRSTISSQVAKSATLFAAVAYITDIDGIAFKPASVVVTDASNAAIAAGKTDAHVLEKLFNAEVELYSEPFLHAKTYAFDEAVIVASGNLSLRSQDRLIESGVLSDDPQLCRETQGWILQIARAATRIDRAFLERIKRIPVTSSPPLPSTQESQIWVLMKTPGKPLLRPYFLATILIQLGSLTAGLAFRAWNGANFRTHLAQKRLIVAENGSFKLTGLGATHFDEEGSPDPEQVRAFLRALRSGNPNDLPSELLDRRMTALKATVVDHVVGYEPEV